MTTTKFYIYYYDDDGEEMMSIYDADDLLHAIKQYQDEYPHHKLTDIYDIEIGY